MEPQWVQRWQSPLPIFMSVVETEILNFSKTEPLKWKRYIDVIFSLWRTERKEIDKFIALANRHHPSIKFTAEISDKEINFLDTTVYKGERFHNQGILDIRTHFKPTETFQYTHFSSCNPHGVRKGLIKGEALRLLRTNSSAKSFYENIYNFKKPLRARGYPHNLIEKITSEVKFTERKLALQKNNEVWKKILPFITTYHPALANLKNILMSKGYLIQDQPPLREIYNEPPIISYKRAKLLGDILVGAKLSGHVSHYHELMSHVWPVNTFHRWSWSTITEAWTKIQKSCWKFSRSSLKYDSASVIWWRELKIYGEQGQIKDRELSLKKKKTSVKTFSNDAKSEGRV